MIRHSRVLVFDIDGVLTDPHTMKFDTEVLRVITDDLTKGIPVAFNTGRSTEWVFERVLPFLPTDATVLDNLLIIAEKGGVSVTFQKAKPNVQVDTTVALPDDFMRAAEELVHAEVDGSAGKHFSDYLFWDAGKRTMASFEKIASVSVDDFTSVRPALKQQITELLEEHNLTDYRLDETVISTDIEHPTAGKHKGAERVLDWLEARNTEVSEFVSFGDSPSDEKMAETFAECGFQSTFVYVGPKQLPPEDNVYTHKRIVMSGQYVADTAKYLMTL